MKLKKENEISVAIESALHTMSLSFDKEIKPRFDININSTLGIVGVSFFINDENFISEPITGWDYPVYPTEIENEGLVIIGSFSLLLDLTTPTAIARETFFILEKKYL